ncbi:MAG: hypothetical protein ACYCXJ_01550 [Thermoleophilia bacterium]
MSRKQLVMILILVFVAALMVTGCADRNQEEGTAGSDGVAGFWAGLWHGLILPVAFIVSLFDDGVGVYEIHNSGNLYNLGFVLGTWFVFGSFFAGSKGKKGKWC